MSFLVALGFLTALPFPGLGGRQLGPELLGRSVAYFPVIGLLLGGLLAAADAALRLALPDGLAAAILLAFAALLTGGLHWDGLMDACDGLFGRHERERRLEIMRDSRVGAFGVLGALCVALIEWNALVALPEAARAAWIALAYLLSRWALAVLIVRYPYARPSGLGLAFRAAGSAELAAATGLAAAGAVALGAWAGALAMGAALLLSVGLAHVALRRLGGLTGDVYGAVGLLCEVGVLVLGARLGAVASWR